jgi:hypothetical protein
LDAESGKEIAESCGLLPETAATCACDTD